jgi:hypothetical protein
MRNLAPIAAGCLFSAACTFSAVAQPLHSLTPLAGFGPSGTGALLAGEAGSFITTDTSQRGMVYNPATGHLIFVDRQVPGNSAEFTGAVYVLDSATGAILNTLPSGGIEGGTIANFAVGVADDGAIYMGNLIVNSNAGPYKIYRWASETATESPTVAFSGSLPGIPGSALDLRWGDTMDVRGSGADTQIIIGSRVSGDAIRATLFTTADGLNFSATSLATDVTRSAFAGGVAFAHGNTFWAKRVSLDLRLMQFDVAAATATTVRAFSAVDVPDVMGYDSLAVDLQNGLLAMMNFDVGGGNDAIALYRIANTNDVPQLLDTYALPINNANNTGIAGFLSFGNGKLYAHSVNNGLFAFDLAAGPLPAPVILVQPAPARALEGSSATLRVIAQRGFTFQWYKNGSIVTGATNSVLTLSNVALTDSGNYSVQVSNPTSSITSSTANLQVLSLQDFYRLTKIWGTAPGQQPYFITAGGSGTAPNQRSFAYNSFSNHLYVVARQGSATQVFDVHVVDADTGAPLYRLNTNGMVFSGQIGLVGIEVAADGAIYACNVDAASGVPNWKLYRWADGNSNTVPQLVFEGDPLGLGTANRWGDAISVRGAGINTEVLIDSQTHGYIAILKPTDASLTAFSSALNWWFEENTLGTGFGRSVQFGQGNTIWQKRLTTPLVRSSYDAANPFTLATTNLLIPFPSTTSAARVDEARNLVGTLNLIGVTGSAPDKLDLYDITSPSSPVLLSRVDFPVNKLANAPGIGKVIITEDRVFALLEQNGMLACRLEIGAVEPPTLQISMSGANITLSWEGTGFTLEATTSLTSPAWTTVPHQAGSPNTATEATSGTAKFYRLRQ